MKSLNDKVAIVVGASSGMGRACALAFAQEGAQVCALARREQELVDLENRSSRRRRRHLQPSSRCSR